MSSLNVYQIGVGSFGKYGFEKLVEMDRNLETVDVKLAGVCDSDAEKLEKAERFAEANDMELATFTKVSKLYEDAKNRNGDVMIYDAGPSDMHADHIYRSMENGFFHLSEKPPSMRREQHLREKKLAEQNKAMWKCDFIERENPVVRKALEILEGKNIDSVKVFRQSSVGVEKVLDPVNRMGVRGGDILDKMIHDVYVLDMIESSGEEPELELLNMETEVFMPKDIGSERLMTIDGNRTEDLGYEAATGMTRASFEAGDTRIELNSSWLGTSQESMLEARGIREKLDYSVLDRDYSRIGGKAFLDEECRFFVVEGERNLVGDMLEKKLFDMDEKERIPLDYYLHDQLYRVIEKAVLNAAGKEVETISDREIDVFMNAIFDVKESVSEGDFIVEREKAQDKLESMIIEDGKILENKQSETLAG